MTTETLEKNRFWEFYFVRYFVGTIVGSAIVLYLNKSGTSAISNLIIPNASDVSNLSVQALVVVAALGLTYCYIASAPILVLHAARGAYLAKDTKKYSLVFLGFFIVLCFVAVFFYGCLHKDSLSVWFWCLVVLVFGLQLIPLIFALRNQADLTHQYYDKLTTARSQNNDQARQYVESYKHLREHGNAFLILLLEVVLCLLLLQTKEASDAVIMLVFWILPAALVWVLGTVLEYRFASKK